MNFFSPESAARRYTKGRPYFHPLVIERVKSFLSINEPGGRALDVGCGTGLSTIALKEVARRVVGVDASAEMVSLAESADGVEYCVARAEALPFREGEFDLVTLSSAFHWLDRKKFFSEVRKMLRPGGRLVVYDNYFSGQMAENSEFHSWYRESYLKHYPPPPRAWPAFTDEDAGEDGFRLLGKEQYQNSLSFSVAGLIDYLVSHSNVIAAVEFGDEEIEEVRRRLMDSIEPLFGAHERATFLFQGPIWYLEKRA